MRIVRFCLALVLGISMIGFAFTNAEAQSFTQYTSGITIQNLSNIDNNVTATYYNEAGAIVDSTTDLIGAFGVKDYATIPLTAGFKGSLIVSADSPVGAVSTLRGDNKGRGAYVGFSQGSLQVSLPVMMKNWGSSSWNTWFAVQNVGAGNANIDIDYAACAPAIDEEAVIPANAMKQFSQPAETCLTGAKVLTSAVVTSDQPIAVIVGQESTVVNAGLVSPGFPSGDVAPVIPLMNSNNPTTTGWRTAISVFNQGTQSTDVVMTYVQTTGATCTETQTIPSQQAIVFAGNTLITGSPATTCAAGAKIVGSAYVSSNSTNQPLVATVNQDRGGLASAYGAFAPSAGTPRVYFPQIQDRNGAVSQWASSIMIMNVGTGPTYVKCTFANSAYAPVSGQLGSYKAWENLERGNIAPSYVGSGECTAYTNDTYTTVDTAAKIVAVANIRGTGNSFDLMMSYEALNSTP